MAGVGIRLKRIYEKNSLLADFVGFMYSTAVTIAPMLLIIINMMVMQQVLGFSEIGYAKRELLSCTMLYIFVFALLTTAPFNAVFSRYVSDAIYEEQYDNIKPCYNLGMMINLVFSCIPAAIFCIREHIVGGVPVTYVFMSFCTYICLVLVFYSMTYLSICKDYQRITMFYLAGMLVALALSLVLRYVFDWEPTVSMLFSLLVGFLLIAALEHALMRQYFRGNSGVYKPVLMYFGKYWQLIITNVFYIAGLYVHNFVYWTTDTRMVVVNSFVCNQAYDMASCLGMFTNISASIIFISRVEMHFSDKYKRFSEAVTGGRGIDIEKAKRRMFRQIASELMTLVRIQFIISVVAFLVINVFLPKMGFSGNTLKIYPTIAAGYFVLFLMYSAVIFLYYFNDLAGAVATSTSFFVVTLVGSIITTHYNIIWSGLGLFAGAFTGWCVAYARIRWVEKHIDAHTFCVGKLIPVGKGSRPSSQVYSKTS